jgi:hypothetical protein
MPFNCEYCGFTVKSKGGLRRHIDGKPKCRASEKHKARQVSMATMLSLTGSSNIFSMPRRLPSQKLVLEKLSDETDSIPTNNPKESSSDENFDLFDEDSGSKGQKRKQVRNAPQGPPRKKGHKDVFNSGKLDTFMASLLPEKLGNLRKFVEMEQMRDCLFEKSEFALNSEVGGEKLVNNTNEEGGQQDDDSDSDGSLDVHYGPDDHYQNPPFHWDGLDPVPPAIAQAQAAEVLAPDYNNDLHINVQPNTQIRDDFREYCRRGKGFQSFSDVEARAVRLMAKLKRKSVPLTIYSQVMDWFHRENGDINEHQKLSDVVDGGYLSRKALISFLEERYKMKDRGPIKQTISLPYSKAKVTLTTHNAWHCIESLLTDPRIKDSDYNFHNNDPLSPPPPITRISELHTGKAYFDAYQKFITKPRQVLLPITMYIDGAVTGQFANLPITALKIALGIHTRKHRDKDVAWRTLGYVATPSKASSRGKHMFHTSGHIDSQLIHLSDDEGVDDTKKVSKAQDFHTMLDCILTTFVDFQTNGLIWDLRYGGKTYNDIEFVPFVIFVKCDTVEANALCGSYNSGGIGVAQLCRYCTCPTENSDLVLADYPKKTTKTIQELVEAEDFDALQEMSQQMIHNAWYKIRFHPANAQGIHGACPSEMLHALLLGVFKYTRECFFEQIGESSKLAHEINAMAQLYGDMFQRHSERDMPKCQFKQGIKKGKLMAKEYRGILLVMAAILRSDRGRELLSQNKNFQGDAISDWAFLVELLLQWEAFLNSSEMEMKHVAALSRKNRFIMFLMKKIAKRSAGMGLKLMKFHAIVHMFWDIFLYTVPLEVDTGANESGHKQVKVAAKLTQKNELTFDYQTSKRLKEFMLFDLAEAELERGDKMWHYFEKPKETPPKPAPPHPSPTTGGETMWVYQDPIHGEDPVYSMGIGPESKEPCQLEWDNQLVLFLYKLQQKLNVEKLQIRGQHKREGILFRAHPNYREKPWRDWALIDWGGITQALPGQIWCFVVVDSIKDTDDPIEHDSVPVENRTYAVIECAYPETKASETAKSALFVPINKEVSQSADAFGPWKRKFYLADVEAIVSPLVVVPNMGGSKGLEYLIVHPRSEWVDFFKLWLDDPHEVDVIGASEPVPKYHIAELPHQPYQGERLNI